MRSACSEERGWSFSGFKASAWRFARRMEVASEQSRSHEILARADAVVFVVAGVVDALIVCCCMMLLMLLLLLLLSLLFLMLLFAVV